MAREYTFYSLFQTNICCRSKETREQKTLSILQQQSKNDTKKAGLCRRYALILPRPRPDQGADGPLSQPKTLSEAVAMMARFDAAAYER